MRLHTGDKIDSVASQVDKVDCIGDTAT